MDQNSPPNYSWLPTEVYEHLRHAAATNNRMNLVPSVRTSSIPVIGPLVDRLRIVAHQLVIFYVNQLAGKQASVNGHIIEAVAHSYDKYLAENGTGRALSASSFSELAVFDDDKASMMDVEACYRLLLNREIDAESRSYWMREITKHAISRAYLVDRILSTPEFQKVRAERTTPVAIQMPEFQIFVRRNDYFIGAMIARWKQYEPGVTQIVTNHLAHGYTFVDVGANIGFFSMVAASKVGKTGKVYSFEPNPSNCDLIRMSTEINGYGEIVELHSAAVAEAKGELNFTIPGIDSNGRVVNSDEVARGAVETLIVQAVTLDDVLGSVPRIDLMKIDIEGAEARAWRGMQTIIQHHQPRIVFEFSPILLQHTSGVDPAEFLEEVQATYDLFIIAPEGVIASKPDTIPHIMNMYEKSNLSHLDLFANPRKPTSKKSR